MPCLLTQGLNMQNTDSKGLHAGKALSKDERSAVNAVTAALLQRRQTDPTFQFAVENVGTGAMKDDKQVIKAIGRPLIVPACPYGRKSGKTYAIWLTPDAKALFQKRHIHPASKRSRCTSCKASPHLPHHRVKHEQAACPRPGDKRPRIREEGHTPEAAANRVPPPLAQLIGRCLRDACQAARAATSQHG